MISWVDLEEKCPIEISRIVNYAKSFDAKINLNFSDLDKAKEDVLDARGDFDLMITTLVQLLYDREILKKPQDHILLSYLKEDLGRERQKMIADTAVDYFGTPRTRAEPNGEATGVEDFREDSAANEL